MSQSTSIQPMWKTDVVFDTPHLVIEKCYLLVRHLCPRPQSSEARKVHRRRQCSANARDSISHLRSHMAALGCCNRGPHGHAESEAAACLTPPTSAFPMIHSKADHALSARPATEFTRASRLLGCSWCFVRQQHPAPVCRGRSGRRCRAERYPASIW